jgi:hypothetical protein
MKTIKQLLVVMAAIVGIAACQKELSVENGATTKSVGALRDSLGNCQPVSINGTYMVDRTQTDSDFVYVLVNIASPGTYKIFTDMQNGFSFSDSGYVSGVGLQQIKLKAKGKPILPIQTDFTVVFDSSFCFFSLIVSPAGAPGANYTLSSAAGMCSGAIPQGTYTVGVPLDTSNKVPIQVNVTSVGPYSVTTGNINGMTFSASGTFTSTGVQTVTLRGTGTPSTSGPNTIPISAGGTTCNFVVNVMAGAGAASYSLVGSPGTCTSANVQGTYTAGTALATANKVTLQVNVTTVGTYSVTTATVNGMTFSGSGSFTSTGNQTITLQGTGTPTTAGTSTFPITAGSSACTFTVTVAAPVGNVNQSDTAWQFNQGTSYFKGKFDTALTATHPTAGFYMYMYGPSTNISGDTLDLYVIFPGTTIQTGSYSSKTSAQFYYYNATTDKYTADPTTQAETLTIVITSYDATTKIVQGTFSGTAENSTGASVPITNGRFKAKVN